MPRLSAYRRLFPAMAGASILFLFFLTSVWGAVPVALGQSPASSAPTAPKPGDDQKVDDDQGPAGTVKVNVNVVGLFFNVKDKHGALMPNLTKSDFDVLEDGKPQTIKYFAAESN